VADVNGKVFDVIPSSGASRRAWTEPAAPVRKIIAGHELDMRRPSQRGHVDGYVTVR